jgi:hypothetical protein
MRKTGRLWLHSLFICLLLAGSTGYAQALKPGAGSYTLPPGSMPSWTVPVLRLVSSTHVEPTTGIVLSDTGLVLVPEDFASMGDEIIVLDGGTDIIRNGRPARIEQKFSSAGMQVLFVEGMKRKAVALAGEPLKTGDTVVLTAFPPAELIAKGEPPLAVSAQVMVFGENGMPSFSSETPLPNVTGALVDSCGNLAGVSIADDVQTMETSADTRYQWRAALLDVYAALQITPRVASCGNDEPPAEAEPEPVEEPAAEELIIEEPPAEEPPAEDPTLAEEPAEEPIKEPVEEPAPEEEDTAAEPAEELLIEILPPLEGVEEDSTEAEEDEESGTSGWLWLLAAVILIGLGFVTHRLRSARQEEPAAETTPGETAAVAEPGSEEVAAPPISKLESVLILTGMLPDGTAFEDTVTVSKHAINIIIGRKGTDLTINSPAVSREHISLNGTYQELTVSDLGSSNGTSINGVPCLEGEIMFIEPGDTLLLGDARCSLEITQQHDPQGEKEQ